MRRAMTLLVAGLIAVGCGDGEVSESVAESSTTTTTLTTTSIGTTTTTEGFAVVIPTELDSCQGLADTFVAVNRQIVDSLGTLTNEEAGDLAESGDAPKGLMEAKNWLTEFFHTPGFARVDELCGGDREFLRLVCAQPLGAVVAGPAAEQHIQDNWPCDG